MGIFNRPSDFSLAMGDWASGSLYPCCVSTQTDDNMINCLPIPNYAPNFEKVGDILVSACPCVCEFMFEISS